jgi:hypothetical protein
MNRVGVAVSPCPCVPECRVFDAGIEDPLLIGDVELPHVEAAGAGLRVNFVIRGTQNG